MLQVLEQPRSSAPDQLLGDVRVRYVGDLTPQILALPVTVAWSSNPTGAVLHGPSVMHRDMHLDRTGHASVRDLYATPNGRDAVASNYRLRVSLGGRASAETAPFSVLGGLRVAALSTSASGQRHRVEAEIEATRGDGGRVFEEIDDTVKLWTVTRDGLETDPDRFAVAKFVRGRARVTVVLDGGTHRLRFRVGNVSVDRSVRLAGAPRRLRLDRPLRETVQAGDPDVAGGPLSVTLLDAQGHPSRHDGGEVEVLSDALLVTDTEAVRKFHGGAAAPVREGTATFPGLAFAVPGDHSLRVRMRGAEVLETAAVRVTRPLPARAAVAAAGRKALAERWGVEPHRVHVDEGSGGVATVTLLPQAFRKAPSVLIAPDAQGPVSLVPEATVDVFLRKAAAQPTRLTGTTSTSLTLDAVDAIYGTPVRIQHGSAVAHLVRGEGGLRGVRSAVVKRGATRVRFERLEFAGPGAYVVQVLGDINGTPVNAAVRFEVGEGIFIQAPEQQPADLWQAYREMAGSTVASEVFGPEGCLPMVVDMHEVEQGRREKLDLTAVKRCERALRVVADRRCQKSSCAPMKELSTAVDDVLPVAAEALRSLGKCSGDCSQEHRWAAPERPRSGALPANVRVAGIALATSVFLAVCLAVARR